MWIKRKTHNGRSSDCPSPVLVHIVKGPVTRDREIPAQDDLEAWEVSFFLFMSGLSETDPLIAKNAACLLICVWRKDRVAMIFFPNAAWVSFPLMTLTENATTHFLCAIAGANFSVAPLLTPSANVAIFLAFFSEPLGVELPDPFFRRDPIIASKFGVSLLPVASAGDEALSSNLVFLLCLDSSLSEFLRGDFFDFVGSF